MSKEQAKLKAIFRFVHRAFGRAIALSLAMALGVSACGKTIFDDDWKPATKPVQREPATPNGLPTRPVAGSPTATSLPKQPLETALPVTVLPPAPLPIPSAAEQATSRAMMNATYADLLKDHTLAGRRKLIATLNEALPKMTGSPPDEFLVLAGLLAAAHDASDLPGVVATADLLGERFEVDPLATKVRTALNNMSLKGDTLAAGEANIVAGLRLLKEMVAAEDIVNAGRLAAALRPAAAGNPRMQGALQKRVSELDLIRMAADRVRPYLEKLQKSPDDSDACAKMGSYYCLQLNRWPEGIKLLAKGSDLDLKKRAAIEMDPKATPTALLQVADEWWAAGEKQPEFIVAHSRAHAAEIYGANLASTTALRHEMLEKRIAEFVAADPSGSTTAKSKIARLKVRWEGPPLPSATRTPLAIPQGKPLQGDQVWKANATGFTLADTVQIGNSDGNHGGGRLIGKVMVDPGFSLEGGTLVISEGSLELNGKPDKPVVFKNVNIVCEFIGTVKAQDAVFDHCTFSKGGKFFKSGGYSSRWELDGCLLHETNFKSLSRENCGVKIHKCVFVNCELGQRHWGPQYNESDNDDGAALARNTWSDIGDCDFYECRLAVSAIWTMQRCNVYQCTAGDPEPFLSKTALTVDLWISPEDPSLLGKLREKTASPGIGSISYHSAATMYPR